MNQNNSKFQKLEMLNAQIDVWIDEEKFDEVKKSLKVNPSKKVGKHLRNCFSHPYCTNSKDDDWAYVLDHSYTEVPIARVTWPEKIDLKQVDNHWSHLFYAKLLRARIQQKGTDCYFRRLDDVVNYLENHLPLAKPRNIEKTKLAAIYLLELSAAAMDSEMLGFAQRARRVIREHLREGDEEAFKDFYDLWARYNIGVAYFHEARYRKAVLEFNKIIYKTKQLKNAENDAGNKEKLKFFEARKWKELLLLPAIIYRANVQLKLQLAYHALDTVDTVRDKYFWGKDYKQIRRNLIQVEAYQQMGQLKQSWLYLKEACERISKLEGPTEKLDKRILCKMPSFLHTARLGDVKRRFVGLLIEDHLNLLLLKGEPDDSPKLAHLVAMQDREQDEKEYEDAVKVEIDHISKLKDAFSDPYFKLVRLNKQKRSGFYEQLSQYLAWLANASNHKHLKTTPRATEIIELAEDLYKNHRNGIQSAEDQQLSEQDCPYCKQAGINLRELHRDHYVGYTEKMFDFYDVMGEKSKSSRIFKTDKELFIKRLLKQERYDGEDLRIYDLELRYKSKEVLEQLRNDYEKYYCWKGTEDSCGFSDLLTCAEEYAKKEKHTKKCAESELDNALKKEHYERIFKQWDSLFCRHLERRSIHETHATGLHFLGLQRWNSSSPAKGRSVGGGYLLYHTDKNGQVNLGIAIDPGFDFVHNLFHMGFSLNDIDVVVISHAHIDHIRDFESMILLLYELQKRGKQDRRIHVILSLGSYHRLEHIIDDPSYRYFIEPYIIDINKEVEPDYFENLNRLEFCFEHIDNKPRVQQKGRQGIQRLMDYRASRGDPNTKNYPGVKIWPKRAYHDDYSSYSDSFGFIIKVVLPGKDKNEVTLGYTGDTKWVYQEIPDLIGGRKIKDIMGQYTNVNCDAIVAHLGSLIDKNPQGDWSFSHYDQCINYDKSDEKCENIVRQKPHPYLVGMMRLLSDLCNYLKERERGSIPLILLSEFGEELRGGIRSDLIHRLRKTYKKKLAFLPVDVGMNVQLWHTDNNQDKSKDDKCAAKVWCVQCNEFVPIEEADFERYGEDEALFCVCETCRKSTPHNVLQERLRHLYEVGCELRTA